MENSKYMQMIFNDSISSLKALVSTNVEFLSSSIIKEPYIQEEIGVFIGLLGDIKGRILIDSNFSTFNKIGNKMFGIPLEGEMLESFTGEFGNMFAGNLSTILKNHSVEIDITPPTVMVGNSKLYGFKQAFKLPIQLQDVGHLTILFIIDEK